MRLTIAIEMVRRANAQTGRDVPALLDPVPVEPLPRGLPLSGFLAQLAATHLRTPQTRERRRRDPKDAARAYATAAHLGDL